METGKLIFITGGARSGKSSFAEEYAASEAEIKAGSLHYIATSRPADKEMIQRIKRHQEDRKKSRNTWITWERPMELQAMEPHFKQADVVLLDCLTVLLSNELFQYELTDHPRENRHYEKKVYDAILEGVFSIVKTVHTLIVVSNEVLTEPLIGETVVRSYTKILGNLHQEIVKHAEKAYIVEAGIPILMKERSC
ncbi:bifunctional adenosylcobinamide kinase/adenosylcobinamide-phosphate guanylyltransferase [Virgibacillus sp. YIM 98842]|jgi:adenosylcobinamide kinase/adenosylcobinamide-phosphate guanylyltransferase|uniref:bifunctional adenosylcobinamide kinase/adenosylcobinamide-phosphate guanylyltransferase n=1 Tax=Virgibacillus sp. YIM 98842 TaxID=2663533 RepID=UPI0013DB50E4|nr:bifunctional adenosylcobinamide kinase/adenosylcobinamide-phosphate guanylyltransferase [Virgibacillus sp. YIM 98842]